MYYYRYHSGYYDGYRLGVLWPVYVKVILQVSFWELWHFSLRGITTCIVWGNIAGIIKCITTCTVWGIIAGIIRRIITGIVRCVFLYI